MGYEKDLKRAYEHAENVLKKQKIKEIKHVCDEQKPKLSFSKLAVIFIFLNCFIIELYSMVVMIIFRDLASLGSLIMGVLGQCVSLLGYFMKARQENTVGGIAYETAMYELKENSEPLVSHDKKTDDDGAVG